MYYKCINMEKINIYKYLNYVKICQKLAKTRRVSFRTLAENTGIHTSYFSRVMVGKAHFSQEQIFSLAEIFELNDRETGYLLLLRDHAYSSQAKHKKYLQAKIEALRNKNLKLENELKQNKTLSLCREIASSYYFSPLTAKLHMYLTIPRYQKRPETLATKLRCSEARIHSELDKLAILGMIERTGQAYKVLHDSVHLEEDDPMSYLNHTNWRMDAIHKQQTQEKRLSDYHFSACFSANQEIKLHIKEMFKDFVVQAQKTVGGASAYDEVYYILFDLYE